MNKLYKNIFLLSLVTILTEARNFKIFVDDKGIDSNFPFEINENLIFEIGYYGNKNSEIRNFEKTSREGKKGSKIDENNLFASIKYNVTKIGDSNLFVGVEYESFKRETEQIGYYTEKSSQLAYNNFVKFNGKKINLLLETVYGDSSDTLKAFARATITPKTKLDIEQDTKIFPNITTGGDFSGDTTLDLSYKIEGEIKWDTGDYFDIGIGGSYAFIPYEYNYKGFNVKRDGYIEKHQKYDEETIEYFTKIRIKKFFSEDILPTIGYKWLEIKNSKDNNIKRDFVFVGIEKWF